MDVSVLIGAVIQGMMIGAIYGLIGLGITMVFAVTGLLNFAHGDFMSLAMYLCLSLYTAFNLDPYISLFFTVPAFFGIGLLFYRFLFRRVLQADILIVVQLTLAMVFIIENGMLIAYGPDFRSVPNFLLSTIVSAGEMLAVRGTYLVTFLVGGAVGFGLYWMIESTDLGRQIRAIAQDRETAQLMGINVDRIQMFIFALGIALLGLSGPLLTSILTLEPYFGLHVTLFAFITFVLGGAGNFLGTLIAGYILGVTESLGMLFLGGYYGAALPYAAFLLLLIFRPSGLLGTR